MAFVKRLLAKRRAKKAASRDMQAAAGENLQSNVDVARGLVDRDLGVSALSNLTADPMDVAAQLDARNRMGEISREGFTNTDRQALNQAFMQSRQEEQAQRGAVMDAAARRGDTSGGNALMASLAAQQGGANRASQFGTDVAMEGRNRALQALGAYGGMAGEMRNQGVNEQVQRGSAVDAFNTWATGQRSADTGMLMGAQGQQSAYQQQRAEALKPRSVGDIVKGVTDFGLGVGGAISGMMGAPGGAPAGGGAGGAASTTSPLSADIDPVTGLPRRTAAAPPRPTGTGGFGGSY